MFSATILHNVINQLYPNKAEKLSHLFLGFNVSFVCFLLVRNLKYREKMWLVFGILVTGTRLDSTIEVLLSLSISELSAPEVH